MTFHRKPLSLNPLKHAGVVVGYRAREDCEKGSPRLATPILLLYAEYPRFSSETKIQLHEIFCASPSMMTVAPLCCVDTPPKIVLLL